MAIRSAIAEAASLLKLFLPPVMFLFCMPGVFCAYVLMTVLGVFISFFMTRKMKTPLRWDQRLRLSALSIMPAGVINVIALLLGVRFRLGFFEIAIIAFFMYCFLKDGRKPAPAPAVIERNG